MDYYDILLAKKLSGGGGGEATLINKNISSNGTYNASSDNADGYSKVVVNVPNPSTGTKQISISQNGTTTENVTDYASAEITVNVSAVNDYSSLADCGISGVVNIPNATKIGQYKLANLTNATGVYAPLVTTLEANALNGSTEIETLVFPSLTSLFGSSMRAMTKLRCVDISNSNISNLGMQSSNQAFYNDTLFDTFIIRSNNVPSLGNINAFQGTTFESSGSGGTLYVPSSMISSYQSATNWSTILGYTNNQIKSIESTHTDPTAPIDLTLYYADGTPIGA